MKLSAVIAGIGLALSAWAESVAGIEWARPQGWQDDPKPMRAANYLIKKQPGEPEDGECGFYYFGPGQGGSIEANIKRWIGQFEPGVAPPTPKKQQINGLPVTTIDHSGVFLGGPPMGPRVKKPGYRMIAAIVEAPEGTVFIKLTGPQKTIGLAQPAFDQLLKSVRKK